MIELFENNLKTQNRQSSKGNQLKWESDGIWYKADYTGYEGLSEYVVSELLRKSSLLPEEYVLYAPEQIKYKATTYNGCKSRDFSGDLQVITLDAAEELYRNSIRFSWDAQDVNNILSQVDIYDNEIKNRVREILLEQRRKYAYMFV